MAYIGEARSAQGQAGTGDLDASPQVRRDAGRIVNTHGDYPEAVRAVGRETGVPVIDLLDMSAAVYEALGPDNAWKAFGDGGKDATHHNNYGAYVLAQCVVNGVRAQVPDLAAHLLDGLPPFDPARPPSPDTFVLAPSAAHSTEAPRGTDRRSLLGLGALTLAAPGLARAQAPTPSTIEVMDLWPGKPPGGEKVTVTEQVILRQPGGDPKDTAFLNVTKPWLMMRRPAKPNGAAILMIPGGGYIRVAVSKAGGSIDAWIADQGVTAFVMDYRLPADGWAAGPDVALQDAQRAIRLIRANASKWGLDPERIAVTGFSAGGHVAARLATQFGRETCAPVDATDKLSTRPSRGRPVLSGHHHDRARTPTAVR